MTVNTNLSVKDKSRQFNSFLKQKIKNTKVKSPNKTHDKFFTINGKEIF